MGPSFVDDRCGRAVWIFLNWGPARVGRLFVDDRCGRAVWIVLNWGPARVGRSFVDDRCRRAVWIVLNWGPARVGRSFVDDRCRRAVWIVRTGVRPDGQRDVEASESTSGLRGDRREVGASTAPVRRLRQRFHRKGTSTLTSSRRKRMAMVDAYPGAPAPMTSDGMYRP